MADLSKGALHFPPVIRAPYQHLTHLSPVILSISVTTGVSHLALVLQMSDDYSWKEGIWVFPDLKAGGGQTTIPCSRLQKNHNLAVTSLSPRPCHWSAHQNPYTDACQWLVPACVPTPPTLPCTLPVLRTLRTRARGAAAPSPCTATLGRTLQNSVSCIFSTVFTECITEPSQYFRKWDLWTASESCRSVS